MKIAHISPTSSYENEKNWKQKLYRKSKHILCSINFFFFKNLSVYEIMWKNAVELRRPQMTIWRMRIACWIIKATNTHTHSHTLTHTHTHTHSHTHTLTHTHSHPHTHTHTLTHTHTHRICNTYCFSTAKIVARTHLNAIL
jgi:ABC-type Zn2+ transport system substrate-binding protein/surface adhesin